MAEPQKTHLWTSDEIAAATGGDVHGDFSVTGVSIDTRSIEPGDLFVALGGVRDGHEFVQAALDKGAAGSLVSRPAPGCVVGVADVQKALEDLGVAARDRAPAIRCAVTGSVGKTSVTQAIAAGLALAGRSHTSVKSYNNHIGVPLTLARMPRDTTRAVFEIGMNHAGEIVPLSRMVQPHVVVVTTVGPVHTENFADGEAGVARAKAEIFAGLAPGGVAVLNADNDWFDYLKAEALQAGAKVVSFGAAADCDAQLVSFTTLAPSGPSGHLPHGGRITAADAPPMGGLSAQPTGGARVDAIVHGRPITFPIRQTGHHWGMNSLAVLLALDAMDVPQETALAALADFEPLAGRGAEREVAGFTLIDESYNANPISMASAIATLGARATSGRRIVALTDMLELGPDAVKFHQGLASHLARAGVDLVYAAGPLMKSLYDALPATQQGGYAETAEQLAPLVAQAAEPGDVMMVKGSNGSGAHRIAQAVIARAQTGGAQ